MTDPNPVRQVMDGVNYKPDPNPVRRWLGGILFAISDYAGRAGTLIDRTTITIDGMTDEWFIDDDARELLRAGALDDDTDPPLYFGERCEKCGGDHDARRDA